MPLEVRNQDITKLQYDAVVNAANKYLLGGLGVDLAIHIAAGPMLFLKGLTMGGCHTGQAKITPGYNMKCKYIIHTVGPKWKGGNRGEPELLKNCYRNSLALAEKYHCKSIAFPLISAGIYGYPKDLAIKTAMAAINEYLQENESKLDVLLCLYPPEKKE